MNGVFHAIDPADAVAAALVAAQGEAALADMPAALAALPRDEVPLRAVRHGRAAGPAGPVVTLDSAAACSRRAGSRAGSARP